MLTRLHISNIVLIDKLNIEFGAGLNALTGETGAGKSILLDALALALGARSDAGLLRSGADTAQVIAEFENIGAEYLQPLQEHGIEISDELVLRRTLFADGKSKAWINDVPVSVKILKTVGDALVEIHGQFENHTLLDPATHIASLDEFATRLGPDGAGRTGGYAAVLTATKLAYGEWKSADKKLKELQELLKKSAEEREYLEHNVRELESLNPALGEEMELSSRRAQMMDAEKNAGILSDAKSALSGGGKGTAEQIFSAAHILERIKTDPNPYQPQIDKLYEAGGIIGEIAEQLSPLAMDIGDLESTEERLFALRAAARKHRVTVDELPDKLIEMREQLNAIDDSDASLKKLTAEVQTKKSEYDNYAAALSAARTAASKTLRAQILKELPDLKLGQADFEINIEQGQPSAIGTDAVTFMIKTNPGSNFAPLHKIASGGELARFMLALRVVLMGDKTGAKTYIFDEVDSGISGATAAAVGERLARLAAEGQALVITHSAQVAGHADKHYLIKKSSTTTDTTTTVDEIDGNPRILEIARIISGEKITDESVASAKQLLKK
ncbi:MAG: DNA repair protein RecN [Alphaproteobacteria bacterium]|nr:DNA repair protein RecN [Alphaproteobacteria bacterium]